jgi:hypothetical protein
MTQCAWLLFPAAQRFGCGGGGAVAAGAFVLYTSYCLLCMTTVLLLLMDLLIRVLLGALRRGCDEVCGISPHVACCRAGEYGSCQHTFASTQIGSGEPSDTQIGNPLSSAETLIKSYALALLITLTAVSINTQGTT